MMADKKRTPLDGEHNGASDQGKSDDRHNDNARAAAELKQEYPRIHTDNI
jgi:hypothetical protein